MKILVVGSGGREHALVWKIAQSPLVKKIYAAPGNAGMAEYSECVALQPADLQGLVRFTEQEKVDLTVVGPELPLVNGIVDLFQSRGLGIFGPQALAARLEGSKVFSKKCMIRYGIPTAQARIFSAAEEAKRYVKTLVPPYVVKADGLAAGKGVTVASSQEEGLQAIAQILEQGVFGEAGRQILIEDCLKGEELSILAFSDGQKVVPLASSQDHKRLRDRDDGPNTGGMGAYSPCPMIHEEDLHRLVQETVDPVIRGLAQEGIPYRGLIYAGLMLTDQGPYVLEYNVRFGDPELQAVLPRLDEDLVPILLEVIEGRLTHKQLRWKRESALTVVLASEGYPGKYSVGFPIDGLESGARNEGVVVFHAGTQRNASQRVVTNGGRVLNVTGMGASLQEAHDRAYDAVSHIRFQGMYYRRDIGWRAFTKVA